MLAPSPYFFIVSIFLVIINMFARFNEIPSITFKIFGKKTKHYKMDTRRMHSQSNNMKTIYPPTNTVCLFGLRLYVPVNNLPVMSGRTNKHSLQGV